MKKKRFVILLDLGLTAAAVAAGPMAGWMMNTLPACPAASLGLLCPACGGTRCVRYLFDGEVALAFGANPLIFLLIWYLAAALALLNVGVLLDVPKAEGIARGMTDWRTMIVTAIVFAIFGVVRNFC